jgi:two-component system, cell cycle sensor histidine kinase PleC
VFLWPWYYATALLTHLPHAHVELSSAPCPEHEANPTLTPDPELCAHALLGERLLLSLDLCGIMHFHSVNAPNVLDLHAMQRGGVSIIDLLHPSQRASFTLDATTPHKRLQLRQANGEYGWYSAAIHLQHGGYLLVLEPIAALIVAEKTLRQAQMEAEQSMRERGEFLRHMSHELRTPLNAIMGFAEMMEQGVFGTIENHTYTEYLALIRASGEDLLGKIVDLMDLSAVGAHQVVMEVQSLPASEVLEAALEPFYKEATRRQLQLRLVQHTPHLMLDVDSRVLRKAIGHVIHNAMLYNNAGGVVEVYTSLDATGCYQIAVRDTGVGIAPAQLSLLRRALQEESQLLHDVETKRAIGLGLTLVKEYVHLHGGEVEIVQSVPNEGTTIMLTLPAHRVTVVQERILSLAAHSG